MHAALIKKHDWLYSISSYESFFVLEIGIFLLDLQSKISISWSLVFNREETVLIRPKIVNAGKKRIFLSVHQNKGLA